jgi:copper chaperone
MATATLQVQGMSCGHCVSSVEGAVRKLGAEATVDLAKGKVTVAYDEKKIPLQDIRQAIEDQGYDIVQF